MRSPWRSRPPARGLTPPIEVPPAPTWKVAELIAGENPNRAIVAALGKGEEVKANVFTPQERVGTGDEQLFVQVLTSQRVLWEGSVASTYAGHALVVELPDADPLRLAAPVDDQPGAPPLVVEVARAMATHAVRELSLAFRRAVAGLADLDIKPGSPAAALGLAAAARMVVPRLAIVGGEPAVAFSQLEARDIDLLGLPLLHRLDGQAVDLRTVCRWMNEGHGLVYAVVEGTPATLDGLDRSKILSITPAEERWVIALVGEGSYVRVDARDVLAEHMGVVCRDLALGLRPYPEFPLLVEGEEDPSTFIEEERRECERELVAQLVLRFAGEDPPPPADPRARADWEDCRRHALRQLQWYACRSVLGTELAAAAEVYDLALFLDADGQPRSLRQASAALQRSEGLALFYGHAYGAAELGHLAAAATGQMRPDPTAALDTVVAPPFLFNLFWALGRARPAFDLVLERSAVRDPTRVDPDSSTVEDGPLAVSIDVEAPGARGIVGVTRLPVAHPEIVVLLPDKERARAFSEMALEHGCVGWVQLDATVEWDDTHLEDLAGRLRSACERALQGLIAKLHTEANPQRRGRYVDQLLNYARRHLTLTAGPDGPARPVVSGELVDRVLSLPVFPSRFGGPMSAWRLVRRFCALFGETPQDAANRLRHELPDELRPELGAFLEWTLVPGNVVRQRLAPTCSKLPPVVSSGPVGDSTIQTSLLHWMQQLRPDAPGTSMRIWVGDLGNEPVVDCDAHGNVSVNSQHWLTRWAAAEGAQDPKVFAWLLLAVYAEVNAALDEVTDAHERAFQAALTRVLAAGELRLLQASA